MDGFNNRINYIQNSNDMNRLKKNGSKEFDNSFAKMRVAENRPDVETVNADKTISKEEARGKKENFVIRNNNMRNTNASVSPNNPVSNAMNRNLFNKFKKM